MAKKITIPETAVTKMAYEAESIYAKLEDNSMFTGDRCISAKGARLLACRNANIKLGEDEKEWKRLEPLLNRESRPIAVGWWGEFAARWKNTRQMDGSFIYDQVNSNFGALSPIPLGEQQKNSHSIGLTIECMELGTTVLKFIAAIMFQVATAYPESFGRVDDLEKFEAERGALHTRLNELAQKISNEWTLDDVTVDPVPGSDYARIFFKISDGLVNCLPRQDSGLRLIQYLREQGIKKPGTFRLNISKFGMGDTLAAGA